MAELELIGAQSHAAVRAGDHAAADAGQSRRRKI